MENFRDIPLFSHANTSILPALFLSRLLPDPSSSIFTTNSTMHLHTVSYIQQTPMSTHHSVQSHSYCIQHRTRSVLSCPVQGRLASRLTHTHTHTHTPAPRLTQLPEASLCFLIKPTLCEMASTLKHTPPVFNY